MTIIYTILSLLFLSVGFISHHMSKAPLMDDNGNLIDKDDNIVNEKGQIIVKKEDIIKNHE
jgi:hypothetical protein